MILWTCHGETLQRITKKDVEELVVSFTSPDRSTPLAHTERTFCDPARRN